MSIGWVYPIGILSTYILFVMEYFLRRYLVEAGYYLPRMPVISVMLVSLFFIILGIIQWFRYERPFAGGKIDASREELLGFTRFLHGSSIIRPFYLEKHVALAFSMNKSLVVTGDPREVSHVRINYDGTLAVIVSEKDYRDYREHLSFDQLCDSMSKVFIRSFEYYRAGFEARIITELKSAR